MKLLLFILLFYIVLIRAEEKCEYNIVAPKAVKLGAEFYFNVDYQCDENSTFALKASIVAWNRWADDPSVLIIASKQFVVHSGDYKRLTLEVPKVTTRRSTLNFTVEATGSETFNRSSPIQRNDKYLSLFIQTDKHFYKPGQTVHYRVLAFDGYLKPYKKPFNITIHDNRGNLVVQRLFETSDFGVLKGELKLSPATPLGNWRLTAKCEDAMKTVYFSVSEYVLPKYKVEIQTPKYYLINTIPSKNSYHDYYDVDDTERSSGSLQNKTIDDFKFSISAKYTFGKPVRGVATVFFTLTGRYSGRSSSVPSYTKVVQLEAGKADVSVTYNQLMSLIPCRSDYDSLDYRSVTIKVNVIERETSKLLTASKSVQVKSGKYKLEYLGHNSYFKAGFKTREYIQMKHINENKDFLADIKHPNGTMKSLAIRISYRMANYSSSTQQRKLIPMNKHGIAILELNVHDMVEKITIEAAFYDSALDQSTYAPRKELTAIKTRDKKLLDLQLKLEKGFFKPNKAMVFTVNASEAITTFYYQLFGKNVLTVSEKVEGELSKTHEFSVLITEKLALELAPSAQILAFYINSNGELVADGMKIVVDDYFANKVELSFNETTALPSSKVSLNIHAPNQSYVGYFAIDQSVLLMGSYDMFSQKMVENDLNEYNIKHFVNWGRKKRSISREPTDDDDEEDDERIMWPFHTLAKSTDELISNAGVIVFSSHYIHKHVHYYDYAYSDDMSDSEMPVPMAMQASSSGRVGSAPRQMKETSSSSAPSTPVRENFPETWFWVDFVKSDSEDQQELLTVPDTITEWVVSAFSTHAEKGLGVSKPAHLTVFQPLFVSINLPPSIIRGEELALTITVFNYQPEIANVTVTLKKSEDYKVKSCSSENINDLIDEDVVRTLEINPDDAASLHVWLVATSVGKIPIEVEAVSSAGSDAVKRKLLVKPEGEQQWKTKSSFIKPTPSTPSNTNFTIQLPPSDIYVPDSAIFQLTTIGDILGPVTANIGQLISVPKGCGEQNIVNLAPNVYSLTYLIAANISDPILTNKLSSHIQSGYQQQLAFHRHDKSYSAFGQDDAVGSTWLTAFVMKCFREAQDHIFIPNKHLQESLQWLVKRQTSEGSFVELPESRIIHARMQGGSGEALTPYVLISLLKNNVSSTDFGEEVEEDRTWLIQAIDKATAYVESRLDGYEDAYTLSIVAYALHLAASPKLEMVQTKLDALATQLNGKMYWQQAPSNDTSKDDDPIWRAFGDQPPTHEIEMTAYNLLIRTEQGSIEKALPIAHWLIEHSNGKGGFVSTQDTVLALEALSKFAGLILETNNPDVNINVTYVTEDGSESVKLEKITKVNSLVLQTIDIPSNTQTVEVEAEGEGFALIQFVSRFNTIDDFENTGLHLEIDSQIVEDQLNLTINTSYSGEESSGMVMIEVKLLTGYTLHDVDMLRLNLRGVVKKVEVGAEAVNFYLDKLSDEVSFSMLFDHNIPVHGIKPVSVQVYRYYQPKTRAVKFYTGQSGSTWISACPQCCE